MHEKEIQNKILKQQEKIPPKYVLRLYVTGASPNSIKAINNLKAICEEHIKEGYVLDVIDVYQQPLLATKEQVVALPLLVKEFPLPSRRLIGNMSDTAKVVKSLALNGDQ